MPPPLTHTHYLDCSAVGTYYPTLPWDGGRVRVGSRVGSGWAVPCPRRRTGATSERVCVERRRVKHAESALSFLVDHRCPARQPHGFTSQEASWLAKPATPCCICYVLWLG